MSINKYILLYIRDDDKMVKVFSRTKEVRPVLKLFSRYMHMYVHTYFQVLRICQLPMKHDFEYYGNSFFSFVLGIVCGRIYF